MLNLIKKFFIYFLFVLIFISNFNFSFAKVGDDCDDETLFCGSGEICASGKCAEVSVSSIVSADCRGNQYIRSQTTAGKLCADKIITGQKCDFNSAENSVNKTCESGYCNTATGLCEADPYCIGKGRYKLIAGLPFTDAGAGKCIDTNEGIGIFLSGILKFILGSIASITTIIIIVAGFMWAFAAGNQKMIGTAKDMIKNAITGLILSLTCGLMLQVINPRLIQTNSLFDSFNNIKTIEIMAPTKDAPPSSMEGVPYTENASVTVSDLRKLGIKCDVNNYKDKSVDDVAQSFRTKMAYRLGSKNGNGTDVEDKLKCPRNKACYDCSGFVKQVLYCSGFKKEDLPINILNGNSTNEFFNNAQAESVNITTGCTDDDTINNIQLHPGDLVGWGTYASGNTGHVLIYVGAGTYIDSHWVKERDSDSTGIYNKDVYGSYGKGICGYVSMLARKYPESGFDKADLKVVRITK